VRHQEVWNIEKGETELGLCWGTRL